MSRPPLYVASEAPPFASPYVLPPAAGVQLGRIQPGYLGTTTVSTTGGMLALWLGLAGVTGLVVGASIVAYGGSKLLR